MKQIDASMHARGESRFVDDVPRPTEMLFAAVCPSPAAHARILSVDVGDALATPGVRAVLTAQDIPDENQVGPIIQDEVLLAEGEVVFVGQPIALVVASSPEAASRGASRIRLKLQELPIITDPREAFRQGEIIGERRTFNLGDVESVWPECDLIVEGSCDIGGQDHAYLETQRARAIPQEDGSIKIYASSQGPYAIQKGVSRVLGLPMHRVEVDVKRLGGGFGGKEDQATHWACFAALGAHRTGKPVEIVLSRADDMRMTGKRHPYVSDFKIGLSSEGRILAFEADHYQNSGAAADLSPAVLERTLFHSTNSYFIPNVRVSAVCCRTNLPPNTAFRGFGGPQGMFVIESAIARAAEASGREASEIQGLNLLSDGDVFPYGQRIAVSPARKCWQSAVSDYGFEKIRSEVRRHNSQHSHHKKGYAMMPVCFGISFTAIGKNQAGALLHVYTDGSVGVTTGGVEMGQGLGTNIASVVARAFGIRPERVKVESTNTTRVANMSPSAASATTLLNGNAALLAAQEIQERLKTFAAGHFEISDPDRVSVSGERVRDDGNDLGWDWPQLVQQAHLARVDLSAHGFFSTPEIWFDKKKEKGAPFAYHSWGTAIVEVTVDCLRGTYTIDAVKIVHELGRPLNRSVDLGQVEGGLAQGLGWMTLEELLYDDKGRLMSGALATYKVPDADFMPDDLQVRFLETEEPLGPFGSKAVGEPPLMYGIGAYFAIRSAMRAFRPGREFPLTAPLTPERVLLGLYGGMGRSDEKTGEESRSLARR